MPYIIRFASFYRKRYFRSVNVSINKYKFRNFTLIFLNHPFLYFKNYIDCYIDFLKLMLNLFSKDLRSNSLDNILSQEAYVEVDYADTQFFFF